MEPLKRFKRPSLSNVLITISVIALGSIISMKNHVVVAEKAIDASWIQVEAKFSQRFRILNLPAQGDHEIYGHLNEWKSASRRKYRQVAAQKIETNIRSRTLSLSNQTTRYLADSDPALRLEVSFHNENVIHYNALIGRFPTSLVAKPMGKSTIDPIDFVPIVSVLTDR